jgi:hypothetical protein
MTDDLVITSKHLLDELNINNDGDGRADHPLQADFCQRLRDIFNEFINSNDGDESYSTYRTKMQQLIDEVLLALAAIRSTSVDVALIRTQPSLDTTSSIMDSSIHMLIVKLMRNNLVCLNARVILGGSW